jgi:predicted transcriptional regulator
MMEYLGIGTSIVKTLRRHKSLPIKLLASYEGSDPDQLKPYLEDLEARGVILIENDRVTLRERAATAVAG